MPDSFEEWWAYGKASAPTGHLEVSEAIARAAYNARVPEGYAVVKIDAGDLVDVLEYHKLALNGNADGSHTGYLAQQEHKAYIEALDAAISRLSQGGWVKIEDIDESEVYFLGGQWDVISKVDYEMLSASNCSFHLSQEMCDGSFCDQFGNWFFLPNVKYVRRTIIPIPPQEEA